MAGLIVLDAGTLIALYKSSDLHHDWAFQMFKQTLDCELWMSVLTLAETYVHPIRASVGGKFEKSISGLGIKTFDLQADSAMQLATIRAATGLKMPDVIVLHAALSLGAGVATTDARLAEAAIGKSMVVYTPS